MWNRARQLILAVSIVVFALLPLNPFTVSAGKGWCKSDPIVTVAGVYHSFEVRVQFPDDGSGHTVYDTQWRIYTAGDVGSVIDNSGTLDGETNTVVFVSPGSTHFVRVTVWTNGHFPMELWVDGNLASTGQTSSTLQGNY